MTRIAICDDENNFCSQLERILFDYAKKTNQKFEITIFYSGEKLIDYMKNVGGFDLVFLDIEFKDMNGIEAGAVIRCDLSDDLTQIIYVSSKGNYAKDLFRNQPLDFVIKPVDYDKVAFCMGEYERKFPRAILYFEFIQNKCANKVAVKNILYVSSAARKLEIHTINGVFETYLKLDDFLHSRAGESFVQIHKSFAVNPIHIGGYHYDYINLTNGETLTISRKYKKDVRLALFNDLDNFL